MAPEQRVPKIGILVPSDLEKGLPPGGELGFLYNLLRTFPLPAVVFGVDFDGPDQSEWKSSGGVEWQSVGKSCYPSNLSVRLKSLYWYTRHRKQILRSGADVLYIQQLEVALPFLFGKKRLPVVFHQHDVHNPAAISRFVWGRLFPFRWFFDIALWLVHRKAEWNIVVEESSIRRARKDGAGDRVTLIRNCVDTEIFRPCEELRKWKREHLGLGASERAILVSGKLEHVKGIDRALHGAAHVCLPGMPWRLLLAGEGSQRAALENLAQNLGVTSQVSFLGRVPHREMPALYNAADILLLASRREGTPMVVLEALACGTPVVATPVGGVAELIRFGENGFVLSQPNFSEIAEAVERCLSQKWDRAEIARSVQRCSSESVGAEVAKLLVDVSRNRHPVHSAPHLSSGGAVWE